MPLRSIDPAGGRIARSGRLAFRPADEEVDQGAEEVGEDNHQHPRHFLRSRDAVVGEAIDQHPDPENETRQADQSAEQTQEHHFQAAQKTKHHRVLSSGLGRFPRFRSNVRGHFSDESFPIVFFSAGTCSSNFSNFTPVKLSRMGGNWLMICVTSPVSLLAPPPGPLPLLIMTIFSVLLSGSLILPATSGIIRTIISITAASLYCLNDSAFCCIAEAVALPCASMMAASARPRALFASASAIPVALATSALAKPVAFVADAAPAASVSNWNFFALASVSTL